MGFVSRGFRGRRRADGPPGPRPAGAVPGRRTSRCSRPGRPPTCRSTTGRFTITGEVDEPRTVDLGGAPGAAPARRVTRDIHCVTKWSKLDTDWEGVSVDVLLDGRRDRRRVRAGPLVRRLHHQPAARGPARRQGLGRLRLRRRAARAGARRPGAAAGAPPLLLEERQVGARARPARDRRGRASGRGYGYHNYGDPWLEQRYAGD